MDSKQTTHTRTFQDETKATQEWQKVGNTYKGERVVKNELLYDEPRRGDYTVVTVTVR